MITSLKCSILEKTLKALTIFIVFITYLPSCDNSPDLVPQAGLYSDIIVSQSLDNTLFFQKSTREFYRIQHTTPVLLPKIVSSIAYEDNSTLRLFDENNEEYVYSINSSITSSSTHFVHGVANFSGPAAESNHLTTDNEENFVLENKRIGPSPGTKGAECYCVPDGLDQHLCDAGGPGTAECQLSTGPLITDKCGVGCAVGFFACCQK